MVSQYQFECATAKRLAALNPKRRLPVKSALNGTRSLSVSGGIPVSRRERWAMKVLVATARTQGARDNDYNWCIEGELVRIGEVCALNRAEPDGGCGCGRGFGGLNSQRATTTAMVADTPLGRAEYVEAVRSSLQQQGWDPCACRSVTRQTPWLSWSVIGRWARLSNAGWMSWWCGRCRSSTDPTSLVEAIAASGV
jgi:hypothetical protein